MPKVKKNVIIFVYSTSHLNPTELVRFYYALKGREIYPGILEKTKSQALAKQVILSPKKADEPLQDFFKYWGCSVRRIVLEVPTKDKL